MLEWLLENLGSHWGSVASVIGAVLTVFYSRSARIASQNAKYASEQTRLKLQSIDLFSEVSRLSGRVNDLLFRLEQQSWDLVVDRATDLRISVAAVLLREDTPFSEDVLARLAEAVVQFKAIAVGADKVKQNGTKPPDVARYRRIVSDQKETLATAAERLKAQVGDIK